MLILIKFLALVGFVQGKLGLEIYKKNEDIIYPVSSDVEERVGNTFSLVCELVGTANDTIYFDDQLSWIRGDDHFRNSNRFNDASIKKTGIKEINKSERKFDPLRADDKGKYVCGSPKFNLVKEVKILVRDDVKRDNKPMRETMYCNKYMFQCVTSDVCVIQHYVCDGVSDCKDGSDESFEKCGKNPCKDKIPCEDGRCIPTIWCCDRHHDPNCNVTVRPKCCQGLPDSYEEMELGFPNVSQPRHTARYLFIVVCVVSILFSIILLLLIISKVLIFAKKSAIQQQRHNLCENIALRNQTNINVIPYDFYAYRNCRNPRNNIVRNIIIDTSDVNDPLLFNPARFNVINANSVFDQPPSYVEVLRNNQLLVEPPPPYQSQEVLNNGNSDETNRN